MAVGQGLRPLAGIGVETEAGSSHISRRSVNVLLRLLEQDRHQGPDGGPSLLRGPDDMAADFEPGRECSRDHMVYCCRQKPSPEVNHVDCLPSDLALEIRCLVCGEPSRDAPMLNYRCEGQDGLAHLSCLSPELALALGNTTAVYFVVRSQVASLAEAERSAFARKARAIVAMAKYAGIAASLKWAEASLSEIEAALARLQEHCQWPENWPYGEFWLLSEE